MYQLFKETVRKPSEPKASKTGADIEVGEWGYSISVSNTVDRLLHGDNIVDNEGEFLWSIRPIQLSTYKAQSLAMKRAFGKPLAGVIQSLQGWNTCLNGCYFTKWAPCTCLFKCARKSSLELLIDVLWSLPSSPHVYGQWTGEVRYKGNA